jgi:sec-independent protein translocase protein TatA
MRPLIANLGPTELFIILGILVLLFGATKLPELARGSGRALRIFKAETDGLLDGEETPDAKIPEERQLAAKQAELERRQHELDAERERLNRSDGA